MQDSGKPISRKGVQTARPDAAVSAVPAGSEGSALPDGGHDPLVHAAKVCAARFKFADNRHPVNAALFDMALRWCLKDTEACTLSPDVAPAGVTGAPGMTGSPVMTGAGADRTSLDPLDVLQGDMKLPSLPQIVLELQLIINNPESSACDVAAVVSRDAGLSAFLLRLVNSAFYSFPSQIDTISRAVTVVGMKQLSNMALGVAAMDAFKEAGTGRFDMKSFWKHSIAVGSIAQRLAERAKLPEPERYFVCGLLHDIGRAALCTSRPGKASRIMQVALEKRIPLYAAEAEVVGFDHARLGGILLRKWNFPFSVTMGVLHHHLPEKSEKFLEPHVVHVADIMAKAIGLASTEEALVPPLSEEAWSRTGLSVADLQAVENELDALLADMFSVLLH
ncbi:HDOD domain-containing protein [Desulfovibrio subterraneus]|uniref:HDOD domain-containing protein n=1 Tax=Desulfovibrio subterraneus TaxID=2718620 RepID=UPI0022B8D4DA|nr:HDOD domain-containing protein [Desulfovibrio subterraneus]WBF65937.1 HDOD domain-containing protein [Desulfovibrio subterraneus]